MKLDIKKQGALVDSKLEAVERDKEKLKIELKEEIKERFKAEQQRQKEKEDELKELKEKKPSSDNLDEEWKVRVDESIKNLKARQDLLKTLPDDVCTQIKLLD